MKSCATVPALLGPIAAAALVLGGCGGSHKIAPTSDAPAPTATLAGRGTPPKPGSPANSTARHASAMATGKHDHAGQFCSGRDQARYVGERMVCVTGRLKPTR